ncbi:MAG: thiamine-phosphate kinase [Gallionella sp.]|nr:MAG: thiamine-phosphate kinase [Gallionella sp.]
MSEFDLIRRYFTRPAPGALLGVGDDAALLQVGEGNVLAVSSDMLVSGTHFFPDTDPFLLGHKTLAVNLSDMAAMGAVPRWATLAIALPDADEAWLEQFSAGFFALAGQYGVDLVGGDTTRGPLNLCVTIFGEVPAQQALRRSGARPGDEIWVSGRLGDAALALAHLRGNIKLGADEFAACETALLQPQPRVALGLALHGVASSAIDISDGLLADLGHILDASEAGARLDFMALPVSLSVSRNYVQPLGIQCALAGGDDYELCFTAPAARHAEVLRIAAQLELPLARIGEIVAGRGCLVLDPVGDPINVGACGYDHFR